MPESWAGPLFNITSTYRITESSGNLKLEAVERCYKPNTAVGIWKM